MELPERTHTLHVKVEIDVASDRADLAATYIRQAANQLFALCAPSMVLEDAHEPIDDSDGHRVGWWTVGQ